MLPRYSKPVWAWALYDWANSAFATAVMAGFFPLAFKQLWAGGLSVEESTFQLGLGNAIAGLLVALTAPLLGAMADCGGQRKRWVWGFAMLGAVSTAILAWVPVGQAVTALWLYGFAVFAFMAANVFYDALLLTITRSEEYDRASALGYALGYIGGGLMFGAAVAMSMSSDQPLETVQQSFFWVAVWWLLFTLPLLLWVQEPERESPGWIQAGQLAWARLRHIISELKTQPVIVHFLIAYWLYIDAVDTVIRMAVDYGLAIGLESTDLVQALLITQFVGFPAALVFGWLAGKLGAKGGIVLGLVVYLGIILWARVIDSATEFYSLAVAIGLVQGGVQALSRSLYASLIPADQAAEYFGFYNMLGKSAVVLGPIVFGTLAVSGMGHRDAMWGIAVLLLAGLFMLMRLPVKPVARK